MKIEEIQKLEIRFHASLYSGLLIYTVFQDYSGPQTLLIREARPDEVQNHCKLCTDNMHVLKLTSINLLYLCNMYMSEYVSC